MMDMVDRLVVNQHLVLRLGRDEIDGPGGRNPEIGGIASWQWPPGA